MEIIYSFCWNSHFGFSYCVLVTLSSGHTLAEWTLILWLAVDLSPRSLLIENGHRPPHPRADPYPSL